MALVTPFALALALYLFGICWFLYQKHRAENLLEATAQLQLHVSTADEVHRVASRYPRIEHHPDQVVNGVEEIHRVVTPVPHGAIDIAQWLDDRFTFGSAYKLIVWWSEGHARDWGFPMWEVKAHFWVKEDKLVEINTGVVTATEPGFVVAASVRLSDRLPAEQRQHDAEFYGAGVLDENVYARVSHLHWGMALGWGLSVHVTPRLEVARLENLRRYNVDCFKGHCRTYCDLAPSAGREYQDQFIRAGKGLPVSCNESLLEEHLRRDGDQKYREDAPQRRIR